jgi:Asp-tRNA(Asn)/Glu-tRNA(Gln) amidotransferase A subunit family amidase
MIQRGITTRVGPICRTVEDTARILDVYAGFDPKDELTSFSIGRKPEKPYYEYAKTRRLDGVRIGVIREYMGPFAEADEESLELIEAAIHDLRGLGAIVVDPGPQGLFQGCADKFSPIWRNQQFISQFPEVFPFDEEGEPTSDHVSTLLDMFFDLSLVPHSGASGSPSIKSLGGGGDDTGGGRYNFEAYIRERGDAKITTLQELIDNQEYWDDPVIPARNLAGTADDLTLRTAATQQTRFALQTVVFQCFAWLKLDAVVYPTGSVPPAILTRPQEPSVDGRGSSIWTYINSRGFPAMTVPAGFTTQVVDRDPDGNLLPPIPAELPVGIDFLGLPFQEHKLFAIGGAYEKATRHRRPPPDFGPLGAAATLSKRSAPTPRPMPKPRTLRPDELRQIDEG